MSLFYIQYMSMPLELLLNTQNCLLIPIFPKDWPCSPEQVKGGWQNEKVDIFALGSIIYYVLAGRKPEFDEEKKSLSKLPKEVLVSSTNPMLQSLLRIMKDCLKYNMEERPHAKNIVNELDTLLSYE